MVKVYFYPSQTKQCVCVLERVNFKASGWGILGHVPIDVALDIHKNNDWDWLSKEEYERFDKNIPDPKLFHLFVKTEFNKEPKYNSSYETLEAAREAADKLKQDPYEFVTFTRIELPGGKSTGSL